MHVYDPFLCFDAVDWACMRTCSIDVNCFMFEFVTVCGVVAFIIITTILLLIWFR